MALPLLGSLGGLLIGLVGGLVGRTLASLGIAFVSYYGVSEALDFLKNLVAQNLHNLPPDVLAILGFCKWVGRSRFCSAACSQTW
ncbi:DUF2523 family protein [Comamonas sp. 26]|uniref:DUF2523 family protein n=1 Tax=Comamonas sp. 26 TaxID=2035201 RepID=UPI000C176378|nr:uncharacterized protein DUF2523 [Comamonas sp. 26]